MKLLEMQEQNEVTALEEMKQERRLGPSLISEAKSIAVQPGAHEGQQ